jgi:hypothetical protein
MTAPNVLIWFLDRGYSLNRFDCWAMFKMEHVAANFYLVGKTGYPLQKKIVMANDGFGELKETTEYSKIIPKKV